MSWNFRNLWDQGFVRCAAVTTVTTVADPLANARAIIASAKDLHDQGVGLAAFPELGLTGYTVADLHFSAALQEQTRTALGEVIEASTDLMPVLVVGAPLPHRNRLYNCAVVIHRGEVLGVVPKSHLPNEREFQEPRWFAAGDDRMGDEIGAIGLGIEGSESVAFGADLVFEAADVPGFVFHVEIGQDLGVPIPPSARAALGGATVLVNLSSSPITVGKSAERHEVCAEASRRLIAGHIHTAAGSGESSTDLSWDGRSMIHERGRLLAETDRFIDAASSCIADVDVEALVAERQRVGTFDDNRRAMGSATTFRAIRFDLEPPEGDTGLIREVDRFPFVPSDPRQLDQDCYEAYEIQVYGLVQRLRSIGNPKLVVGVSGGLDSTHAMVVAAKAMDRLDRPRSDILAFTMPGFATTEHTRNNAEALARALGTSFETIDIRPTAKQMLTDMGHPFGRGEEVYDITFENVQAGLRTDYLFRIANQRGGIVLGTGDLSELALGWCTYGVGDQMSHYGVNAGVPKTLIQHLIRWAADRGGLGDEAARVLRSVLNTEISPELVPTREGEEPQSTEASIGPYALQDFNLHALLHNGARPSKIAWLAEQAWSDASRGRWPENLPEDQRVAYDLSAIRHWLQVFCRRFITQQFKRSALPDGPKVVTGGSLSPRGGHRAPSDASPTVWLTDLERVPER